MVLQDGRSQTSLPCPTNFEPSGPRKVVGEPQNGSNIFWHCRDRAGFEIFRFTEFIGEECDGKGTVFHLELSTLPTMGSIFILQNIENLIADCCASDDAAIPVVSPGTNVIDWG